MNVQLTSHQQDVFEAIKVNIKDNLLSFYKSDKVENHLVSLTGAAGTGKSFLTAQIIQTIDIELKKQDFCENDGICVTAPTHKAVKVLKDMLDNYNIKASCKTIHSFLNIKPFFDDNTGEEKFKVLRINKKLSKASLLIIDESSMISKDLYLFIIEAVKTGRVKTVLFIGDQFQLLPINSNENPIFQLKNQYQLKEIVRQAKESPIIELATKIRTRIENQEFINLEEIFKGSETQDIEFFNNKENFIKDFYKNENWQTEDKIATAFTNKDVESFNKLIRNQFWLEKDISNPPYLQPQDKIRFKDTFSTGNIYNLTIFQNSEEVTIDTAEAIEIPNMNIKYWKCTVIGRKENQYFLTIDPDSLDAFNNILNGYVQSAKTSQFPHNKFYWGKYYRAKNSIADIQYIYAATIHKLQGSTFDTVYMDFSGLMNNNHISNDLKYRLVYVAITRARKNIKIFY